MKSESASYKAAGVDITAGYKAVELMKAHVARTKTEGVFDEIGGFGGLFGLNIDGMKQPLQKPHFAPAAILSHASTLRKPMESTPMIWRISSMV